VAAAAGIVVHVHPYRTMLNLVKWWRLAALLAAAWLELFARSTTGEISR
jgi:hypothetical protein